MSMALNAVLDFVAFVSTAAVIVLLINALQPLFEKVRDSCQAGQTHEGRALLLWSAFWIHVAWVAAAALYCRSLSRHWEFMASWLADRPTERAVYALLHFDLFILLFVGIFVCAATVAEICWNFRVYKDLLMIARLNTNQDLEAQHASSSADAVNAEAETPSAAGDVNTSSPTQDEDSPWNGQAANGDLPTAASINDGVIGDDWPDIDRIIGEVFTQPVHDSPHNVEEAARTPKSLDSEGDEVRITPSSLSSSNSSSGIDDHEYVDDDDDRYARRGANLLEFLEHLKNRNPTPSHPNDEHNGVIYHAPNFANPPYKYGTPILRPQDRTKMELEPLSIGEPPSPCDSCSSAHAASIPTVKRSLFRVPITPTSPTVDAEDADNEKTDGERKARKQRTHF